MTGFYQLRSPFTGTWLKIRAKDGEIVDGRATPWPETRHAADLDWDRPRDNTGRFLRCGIPPTFGGPLLIPAQAA